MATRKPEQSLRPPLLDRFIDPEWRQASRRQKGISATRLKRAIGRDLEWLLNTCTWHPWDLEDFEESRRSILNYGITDLTPYSWTNQNDANAICAHIEHQVKSFEPRLLARTVKVTVLPSKGVDDFRISFRIDAMLHVEPIREQVFFDTTIDVGTGAVDVADSG